jgi:chromosome segregation ATPase
MLNETSTEPFECRVLTDIRDAAFVGAAGIQELLIQATTQLNQALQRENEIAQELHKLADEKEMEENSLVMLEIRQGKAGQIDGSNEATRKMQAALFLERTRKINRQYDEICGALDLITGHYQAVKVELAQKQNEFDAYRAVLSMYTAKLRALQPS